MMDSRLEGRLRSLGRRLLALGTGLGVGWGLAVGGILVAAAVWFDLIFDLSGTLRLSLLLATGASALILAGVFIARSWRKANPLGLAALLDSAIDGRGRISAGADLALDPRERSPLSAALARMAVAEAAGLASNASFAAAAPTKPLVAPVAVLAMVILIGAGVSIGLPRLASMEWARFADPFGDHPPYSPLVLSVQPGNAKVHFGGALDVVVEGHGAPIDKMELVVNTSGGEAVLPLFPETGDRWRTTLVQINEASKYFVRSGRARSDKYSISVVTAPRIVDLKVKVVQPAYAYRAEYEGPIPKEGLSGLPGTKISVRVGSNRPLREASAVVTPTKGKPETFAFPAISSGSQEAHGEFTIRESGKFELHLVDDAGERSTESATAALHVLADERPFVRILEPKETSFATPSASLPVILSAEDDCSVAKLQLFRSLNGSQPTPVDLALPPPPLRRLETDVMLPLSAFGLRAGDEIQLFARVEDANPAGAQGFESPVVTVRIIEQSEYERLTQRQLGVEALLAKYQQAERRMESLAEETEDLLKRLAKRESKDAKATAEEKKELKKLAERLAEEAKAMEALAKQTLPYDVDKEMTKEIAKLAEALQKAADEAAKTAAKEGLPKKTMQDQLEALKKQLAKKREEFDREAAKPIGDLAKAYALVEDEAKFLEIYRRQRDLEKRMASFRGKERLDDPGSRARMRDMEAEQRELRDALGRLLDDIETHANALPESDQLQPMRETALKFASDVRASGAVETMTAAEASLAEFAGTKSATSAKEAADILEKFIARCSGDSGAGAACKNCLPKFQPKLGSCMGNSLQQLLANAGLKPGSGPGSAPGAGGAGGPADGSRDGYSMAANTLKNVGLYGNLPTTQNQSGRGSGKDRAGSGRVLAASPGDGQKNRLATSATGEHRVTGEAAGQVPPNYRRRVAEYFQRIADEGGEK